MMVVFEKRPVCDSLKQTADIWFRGHLTCLCKSDLITMLAQLNLYNLLLGHPHLRLRSQTAIYSSWLVFSTLIS